MQIKKLTKSSLKYREICESGPEINNLSPIIKSVRLLIRFTVRLFGYKLAIRIFDYFIIIFTLFFNQRQYYVRYLIEINKTWLGYLLLLSNGRIKDSIKLKIDWAKSIISNSHSQPAKDAAKLYLDIMSKYGFYSGSVMVRSKLDFISSDAERALKKFYIYGPNSNTPPNSKYSDYTTVFTKMLDDDVTDYGDVILFLNSFTYTQLNKADKSSLAHKYKLIYVHCATSKIEPPFVVAKFPAGDSIASVMGLGRILYCLLMEYGRFQCVIEGFDFYLSERVYGGHVLTGVPIEDHLLTERVICKSLSDHDALFNYLYVKELVSRLDLAGTPDFLKIINMTSDEYIQRLVNVRKFETLLHLQ